MIVVIHYFLHFLFPAVIAYFFYRKIWVRVYIVLILTMLVDLDHLLASPIFDPNRCSIGFHPLHSYYILPVYFIMLFIPKTRIIGLGLSMHMAADLLDCYLR